MFTLADRIKIDGLIRHYENELVKLEEATSTSLKEERSFLTFALKQDKPEETVRLLEKFEVARRDVRAIENRISGIRIKLTDICHKYLNPIPLQFNSPRTEVPEGFGLGHDNSYCVLVERHEARDRYTVSIEELAGNFKIDWDGRKVEAPTQQIAYADFSEELQTEAAAWQWAREWIIENR